MVIFLLTILNFLVMGENEEMDKKAINSIIVNIVKSAENQDPAQVQSSYHKDYSQYLDFMGGGIGRSTKKQYQEALKAKKIGGEKLTYKVIDMDIDESIAYAKVIIKSSTIKFYNYLTFMKENKQWYLTSRTLRITMKK